MSACFIIGTDQESHTEGSLGWMLSFDLGFSGYLVDQSLSWMVAIMCVPIVQALVSHVLAEIASISSQSSNGNAHMIINIKYLLLVTGKVMWTLLQRDEDLNSKSESR